MGRMGWTCPKCKTRYKTRNTLRCARCGRKQPKKRVSAHMRALDLPYEEYVRINGGDFCWIGRFLGEKCKGHRATGRFHRDHDHGTGAPRGLLCFNHNKRLLGGRTLEQARALVAYLERSAA